MIYLISRFPPAIPLSAGIQNSTMETCVEFCQQKAVLSIDSETSKLSWLEGKIVMFQVGDKHDQFVIDARSISLLPLKPILENRNILKLGQNLKFDYHFLRKEGIMLWNIYDTFLAEMVLYNGYPGKGYSLEAMVLRYFNMPMDKQERNKFIGIGSNPFTERQIRYGANDLTYLVMEAAKTF